MIYFRKFSFFFHSDMTDTAPCIYLYRSAPRRSEGDLNGGLRKWTGKWAPLHLVQGDHAGERLRAACQRFGLPGRVRVIGEDLSHGPLDDGVARIAYMRQCYLGFAPWGFRRSDAFSPWRRLARLAAAGADQVVVWYSDSVADRVFLAMACRWLADADVCLAAAHVPPTNGRPGVGVATPEALATLFDQAAELAADERANLVRDFDRISAPGILLRRLAEGALQPIPLESYDSFLRDAVDTAWQPAPRLVAAAMARCDVHNRMTDLFFSSRLRRLIAGGEIEVRGEQRHIADSFVRSAE